MGKNKGRILVSIIVCLIFGIAYLRKHHLASAFGKPHADKISVLVMYLGPLEASDAIQTEDFFGYERITPFLTERGYEVEDIYSMHRLVIRNGGSHRALLKAFEDRPNKDGARVLMVTIAAQPGEEPYTIRSGLALIDLRTSGFLEARISGRPPHMDKLWTYESEAKTAPPAESLRLLKGQLEVALAKFDQQYRGQSIK